MFTTLRKVSYLKSLLWRNGLLKNTELESSWSFVCEDLRYFPVAAETNYHKLDELKQWWFIPSQFWRSGIWNQFHLSCDYGTSKAVLPLEALGEHLYLASRTFCQQPSFSLLVATSLLSPFLWSHFLLLICVSNSPLLSSHTDTCGCTGCQPHNWDNLPISWCLT